MPRLHKMIRRSTLEYLKQSKGWILRGRDEDCDWVVIDSFPNDWEPPLVDPNCDNGLLEEYDIYFV